MIARIAFFLLCTSSPLFGQVEVIDLSNIDLKEDEIPLENLTQMEKANSVKIEDIVEPENEYRYSSFGGRDPFQVPIIAETDKVEEGQNPETEIQKVFGSEIPMVSPLQAYPLKQLSVKGVWQLPDGEARAIVMTPEKQGVVVKKGDPIAVGKILEIQRKRMLVRQYRLREDGTREFTDIEVKIGNEKPKALGTIKLNPGEKPEFERLGQVGLDGENNSNGTGGQTSDGAATSPIDRGIKPDLAVPQGETFRGDPALNSPVEPASAKPVTFETNTVPDTIVNDGPAEPKANKIPAEAAGLARSLGVPTNAAER